MDATSHPDNKNVSTLIELEQSVRRAESAQSLLFVIVNQTRRLISFDQAVFLSVTDKQKKPRVKAISNIAAVDRSTPFAAWLERMARQENLKSTRLTRHELPRNGLADNDLADWNDFSPPNVLWVPLVAPQQGLVGVLWLSREKPWNQKEFILLDHLSLSYGHALQVFLLPWSFSAVLKKACKKPFLILLAFVLAAAAMIPVNLSALAPVEIVPIDPFVVSSSMNGVVEKILVSPNQTVAAGQPLVHLDDTEVRNSVAIAVEALEVAKVQLEKVERGAFINTQSGEMMAELTAQVDLRNAELTFARERLKKSLLTSEKSGVAVVNQPDAWAGRPVSTGEKILQIADPDQVELQIMLPVADAVLLSSGNRVRIFLDSAPLSPKEAQIVRSEYEAYPTESGILSYRVTARFTDTEEHPRIGLRGTAKVFGKQVSLFYYLFRRPITAFRQWTGW